MLNFIDIKNFKNIDLKKLDFIFFGNSKKLIFKRLKNGRELGPAPPNLPIVETMFLLRKLFWANGHMGIENIFKKIKFDVLEMLLKALFMSLTSCLSCLFYVLKNMP